ncbi:hypothetical protein PHJA_002480600 [Phtheirospermum japonicum]|uniref:Uncharacterized protein n=1 Tax=Phtheirospermum japonicum TaxID=374723 RepID=A0A830CS27_9LAMI|nr:hypothetical protein PHJA_002480600 [Phtheirospermum japonicum]
MIWFGLFTVHIFSKRFLNYAVLVFKKQLDYEVSRFVEMSCIHITACQLSCSPSAFPTKAFQLNTPSSTYIGTRFPKISLKSTPKSRYQPAAIVSLFGGIGKSENENQDSPWKVLENVVGNFKKDQSVEDVLKQQIQKQEYYDGGDSGGKRPGGGGGGDGDGFGEIEDEGLSGVWDEFGQYIYIIEGEEITVLAKDFLRFVFTRQKSIRLRRLMDQWSGFLRMMKETREYEDPYWLEREIINTPTCYDHPANPILSP